MRPAEVHPGGFVHRGRARSGCRAQTGRGAGCERAQARTSDRGPIARDEDYSRVRWLCVKAAGYQPARSRAGSCERPGKQKAKRTAAGRGPRMTGRLARPERRGWPAMRGPPRTSHLPSARRGEYGTSRQSGRLRAVIERFFRYASYVHAGLRLARDRPAAGRLRGRADTIRDYWLRFVEPGWLCQTLALDGPSGLGQTGQFTERSQFSSAESMHRAGHGRRSDRWPEAGPGRRRMLG